MWPGNGAVGTEAQLPGSEARPLSCSSTWVSQCECHGHAGCHFHALDLWGPVGTCVLRNSSCLSLLGSSLLLPPHHLSDFAIASLKCNCAIHQHYRRKQLDKIEGKNEYLQRQVVLSFPPHQGAKCTHVSPITLMARDPLSVEGALFVFGLLYDP